MPLAWPTQMFKKKDPGEDFSFFFVLLPVLARILSLPLCLSSIMEIVNVCTKIIEIHPWKAPERVVFKQHTSKAKCLLNDKTQQSNNKQPRKRGKRHKKKTLHNKITTPTQQSNNKRTKRGTTNKKTRTWRDK